MRNIAETSDGIDKLKLATAAAALLIPPVFMAIVAPQQESAIVKTSQSIKPVQAKPSIVAQPLTSSRPNVSSVATESS